MKKEETIGPYQLNTIVVGDCLEVIGRMPDGCVDLVFADPPYVEQWPNNWLAEARRVAKQTVLVTPGIANMEKLPKADWCLAWIKKSGCSRTPLRGFNCWEPIYVYGFPRLREPDEIGRNTFDIYEYITGLEHDGSFHPHPKPKALISALIEDFSDEGEIVFDPFMGSGTTAVAAEELGRRFFGCDTNPSHVKGSLERLEKARALRPLMEKYRVQKERCQWCNRKVKVNDLVTVKLNDSLVKVCRVHLKGK